MPPDITATLRHYPDAIAGSRWMPLGAGGGFSGAAVWRGERDDGTAFALKRWQPDTTDQHLRQVHRWMGVAREAGSAVVPRVHLTVSADTVVVASGHRWDVADWMPGTPDLCEDPPPPQWAVACATLAELHRAWAGQHTEFAPAPAVHRRLRLLADWERAINPRSFDSLPRSEREFLDGVRRLTTLHVGWCRGELRPWEAVPTPLIPCLCDGRPEHFLFAGRAVSGVIDYGAMKVDTPAVDLARLLGDDSGTRGANSALGLTAYADARPPFAVPESLVRTLADTGVVCAAANWQLRLADEPPPENLWAIRDRLSRLVRAFRR